MNKTKEKYYNRGLCIWCGKVPEELGQFCNHCKELHKQAGIKSVKKRIDENRCVCCGNPMDRVGRNCTACTEKAKLHLTELKAYRKANKLCRNCGKPSDAGVNCRECQDKINARDREKKRIKREMNIR